MELIDDIESEIQKINTPATIEYSPANEHPSYFSKLKIITNKEYLDEE